MSTEHWLMVFSGILIVSFLFNQLQQKVKISSVILLIFLGVVAQLSLEHYAIKVVLPDQALKVFGTLGLLIIVLEAVMDMKITEQNAKVLKKAFIFSTVLVFANVALISWGFVRTYHITLTSALVYAVPISIVSSAIAIPSLQTLSNDTKEFLVLESIFSDIIGVLLFNFLTLTELSKFSSVSGFVLNMLLMIVISLITTVLLGVLLGKEKSKNIHVAILAILILMYSLAKIFHLSSLLLILIFGLFLRNCSSIVRTKYGRWLQPYLNDKEITNNLQSMHEFIDEFGFIIRSIFFILLGFSIDVDLLLNPQVLLLGAMVAFSIYALRWVLVYWMLDHKNLLLPVTMAPRGLITVLLFFQIPDKYKFPFFHGGVTFFIVIMTCLVMSSGLILSKGPKTIDE
ncbi:MAG: hypothetical protein EKK64_08945 [Neisseriaceae bacterium]|nr:MAG: hypothetical protein EKK64_08945 [Neisseriaceae bacterium]